MTKKLTGLILITAVLLLCVTGAMAAPSPYLVNSRGYPRLYEAMEAAQNGDVIYVTRSNSDIGDKFGKPVLEGKSVTLTSMGGPFTIMRPKDYLHWFVNIDSDADAAQYHAGWGQERGD